MLTNMSSTNESCETLILPDGEYLNVQKMDAGNIYTNEQHSRPFRNNLSDMKKQELLCDVTLVTDHTEEVRAHKVILAASSLFFYTLFSSMLGKSQDRIDLEGIQRYALPQIIQYIYTGKIFITEDNVARLMRSAHKLAVTGVVNACIHFLQTHLNIENFLSSSALAEEHDFKDLLSLTNTFMTEHFSEIVKTKTYLDLSKEQLSETIKSDRLNISSEIEVFKAVVLWIKHELETRLQYLTLLMNYVRFPLMSTADLLETVDQETLFETNTQCRRYFREAMRYHILKKGNNASTFFSSRTKPRISIDLSEATSSANANNKLKTKKVLTVVGKIHDKVSMNRYDFEEQRWLQGPKAFDRPCRSCSFLLNTGEKVYMIGGNLSFSDCRKVDVFDSNLEKWSECSNLLENRDSAAAAILDGNIYISGGYGKSNKYMKSCEKLDKQTGCWIAMADMLEGRYEHSMCAMDGKIYAVGGRNDTYLTSVEYYTPETNSWTHVPDMSVGRCGSGVAALDGQLYVVAGKNKTDSLKCVEVFNSANQKWTRLADLNVKRATPGLVATDELIYVVGGINNEDGSLNSVEVFYPCMDTWTILPNKMGKSKHSISAAVINEPY